MQAAGRRQSRSFRGQRMSYEAVAAVMESSLRPPSLKLAAVAMANFLNAETSRLNPSMSTIAKVCGLSEVQARRQVHELIAMGVLTVMGNQAGGSAGSSRRYCLHLDRLPITPRIGESPTSLTTGTPIASDTPLADESHPSHGRAPPLSPAIGTPPIGETQIKKESGKIQERNQEGRQSATAVPCPSDVDRQTWTDWQILRKAKNAPVTDTVVGSARREAADAGMPLDAFLQVWCLRGSQGLQADWLKPHERQTQSLVQSTNKHAGAAAAIFDGAEHV
ncbi:helix-turn-helix domain-containing protein [Hydrogenophaga sp.]|uniref:helix-turn-helix domain-containing protein n=1 Tax=Hydrogenophaga sp. TaxID=1904254 RepID=UPI00352695ED